MKSRIAQIIADSTDSNGKVDPHKVYQSIMATPDSPEAIFADACIYSTELLQSMKLIQQETREIHSQMELIVGRAELAIKQTKDLPARVSERLDPKPVADVLTNTLKLELSRSGFKEATTEMKQNIEGAIGNFGVLKTELAGIQVALIESIKAANQTGASLSGMSKELDQSAKSLGTISRRSLYGSAAFIGLAVAVILAIFGLSAEKRHYDEKLAQFIQSVGDSQAVVMELERAGKRLEIGPVEGGGRYLKVTGAVSARMSDNKSDGLVFLK